MIPSITQNESHPVYQELAIENGSRQYDFLQSIVKASINIQRPLLSQGVIKALNFHAIACLHGNAGEYRPCAVQVGNSYIPPDYYRVGPLMEDFVNQVNLWWDRTDPVYLASFILWRLNHIHPFINGNGRTARAACHFALCVKMGGWIAGDPILPQLLARERVDYVSALKIADQSAANGALDLTSLHALISKLLTEQINANAIVVPQESASP